MRRPCQKSRLRTTASSAGQIILRDGTSAGSKDARFKIERKTNCEFFSFDHCCKESKEISFFCVAFASLVELMKVFSSNSTGTVAHPVVRRRICFELTVSPNHKNFFRELLRPIRYTAIKNHNQSTSTSTIKDYCRKKKQPIEL